MGSAPKRPPKKVNPLAEARHCISEGRYTVTYHAKVRQVDRVVPLPDVLYVIEKGHWEKRRDRIEAGNNTWSYSIKGKATDKRELRVVISFDDSGLLIITVIVLKGEPK